MRALVLAGLVAAGCAGVGTWEHPELPEIAWPHDAAACDRVALEQAENDYARGEPHRGVADRWGAGRDFAVRMARYEAEQAYDGLFGACMRKRGYRRVDGGADD